MKAAIGVDASQVIALIPAVGDVVADVIEDTHTDRLKESLTADEYNRYLKWDKSYPSSIALLRALQR